MSRYYNMFVRVVGANPDRFDAIKDAASAEWEFENWDQFRGELTASADDRLCGGETEQQFAERLAKAVWTASGGPCEVEVKATYLEDTPYEEYSFDEFDYERIMGAPGELKATAGETVLSTKRPPARATGACASNGGSRTTRP